MAEYPALEIAILPPHDPSLFDRLYALLDDYEPAAIHDDEIHDVWRVFFRAPAARDAARAALTGVAGIRV